MPTKKCRRGHAQTKANVRTQTNRWRNAKGKVTKRTVKICVLCRKFREGKRAAGVKFKDCRRGAR